MTSEQRHRLINRLQHMARRPGFYIGDHDPLRAELWLSGFVDAVIIQDDLSYDEIRRIRAEVLECRGWEVRSTSVIRQMLGRKMAPPEIVIELVQIEIDIVNKLKVSDDSHCVS